MSKGKIKKAVDHLLHSEHGKEESEASVSPQQDPKADYKAKEKQDHAAHPKFAKFKGEDK